MTAGAEVAERIEDVRARLASLRAQVGRAIVGQDEVVEQLLVALLADGHVLIEGPPGLGKTLLVRSLATALSLSFRRVQCTPDLVPSDVTGSLVLVGGDSPPSFAFQEGPVFTQILLCDEINRATPKTQAALLEAMEERAVTAGGETRPLPVPFLLLATENPIEMEGTYPLPEAQLDRFLLKVLISPPGVDDLVEIVRRTTGSEAASISPVMGKDEVLAARQLCRAVTLAPPLLREIAELALATQPGAADAPPEVRRFVRYGASPRGARALALAAKARALLEGRPHVAREDVLRVARPALRHRLILSFEAEAEGADADGVLTAVLARHGG